MPFRCIDRDRVTEAEEEGEEREREGGKRSGPERRHNVHMLSIFYHLISFIIKT